MRAEKVISDGSHLIEKLRPALHYTDEKRIEMIRSPFWIGYTRSKEIMFEMEDLLTEPKDSRMPNLLIVGKPNNGKTRIIERFAALHPAYDNPDGDSITIPILKVQAPPLCDANWLYNQLLDALFAPYNPNDHPSKKQRQLEKIIGRVGIKMIIIDELHNLLAGHPKNQRQFLNVIRFLGNDLKIPIVGAGIVDASRVLHSDPQLSTRFDNAVLPRWKNDAEWKKLLVSFERMIPLKNPSYLSDENLATELYLKSEGIIGEISRLLKRAAKQAVKSKSECISKKELSSINWVPPSERRKHAELEI